VRYALSPYIKQIRFVFKGLKNSTWCPHCVYVFCTDLRTNSNFCLINIKRLVFITEVESVYSAVRAEFLYKTDTLRL
jgi:hypothetical protein